MRFSATAAPLLAASFAAATRLSVPAVQRKLEDITATGRSPLALLKRSCVYGTLANYECCSDDYYCTSSEFCAGNSGYCCPTGTTYAGDEECQLPSGSYEDALPDLAPWYGSSLTTTMSGQTYFATVVTIHYTSWGTEYNYDVHREVLTSYEEDHYTTMYTDASDTTSAASYFNSYSNSLVGFYSSYYSSLSADYVRRGLATAPAVVTLSTPIATGASAAATSTTAAVGAAAASSSSSGSHASTTGKPASSTTSAAASASGSSNNATTPQPPKNNASSARASGSDLFLASGLTLFALASGLSAFFL
ncbi:hypothetical protein K461DRAFT_273763 [Myriangium duriaei CBS 260.36]|uniref:Chitin-binding type-1 domain-containing protein n=1 Tax=Myriangium duriaei CBS 260.36 TaxID=1168546 RepID=A0A9P4JEJ6_9PEZI|nr:hypothetical protein K461DRAFT_273763 [Myriangium duriaei CBS 260.36]